MLQKQTTYFPLISQKEESGGTDSRETGQLKKTRWCQRSWRPKFFPILMFDMNINWSFWRVSAWFYSMSCCPMIGWYDNCTIDQLFILKQQDKTRSCKFSFFIQSSREKLIDGMPYFTWLVWQTNAKTLLRIIKNINTLTQYTRVSQRSGKWVRS